MTSNYNDSGYSVTLTNVTLASNSGTVVASVTLNISPQDIYRVDAICGIYKLNIGA
jgi:hypothetical protein